jgi:hypothetical protein
LKELETRVGMYADQNSMETFSSGFLDFSSSEVGIMTIFNLANNRFTLLFLQ